MGDGPNTGDVKVILKLDTTEAARKVAEVERRLRNNERERRFVVERVNKDGFGAKAGGGSMGKTIADKMVEKILPKLGGQNPFNTGLAKNLANLAMPQRSQPQTPHNAGMTALGRVASKFNPFPQGGVSGDNAAQAIPTLALAGVLYAGASKLAKFSGLGLAYHMKNGAASVKTIAGEQLNEVNSAFSYVSNYGASFRDAADRLVKWDDAVSAITGKLPDTEFYEPKFQRMALFERQFADMVARNAALTRAGARGNSSLQDQMVDLTAQGLSR
jgi:hypothetical protein